MFDFPASPTVGATYQVAGKTYVWDGEKWRNAPSSMPPAKTAQARNRVVNPAMQISQENGNTGGTTNSYYTADQWHSAFVSSSTITAARGGGAGLRPNGLIAISASPAETAAAAGEFIAFAHRIEGLNVADFFLGTATSQQAVLAFDVNIPVAGTYWVAICTATASHTWLGSYTISAAEIATWVRKSMVIPAGAINAGTWATDNTLAIIMRFTFHCGSTFVGVNGFQSGNFYAGPGQALGLSTATACYLTNVGLHLDPDGTGIAPPFQVPAYDDDLRACMRYYNASLYAIYSGGSPASGAIRYTSVPVSPPMRTAASMSGATVGQVAFPAAVGTLAWIAGCIREARTSNAVDVNNGHFHSSYIANARM